MKYRAVRYSPEAERDLERISDWLADVASETTAIRYIRRIKQRVESLIVGSQRGTMRDEDSELRVIGILPRVSVAFRVDKEKVEVLRVIHGGQNWLED